MKWMPWHRAQNPNSFILYSHQRQHPIVVGSHLSRRLKSSARFTMGADKGKKLKVADKNDEENAEPIDAELVVSIEKLQEIQDELEKINEKASDEVLEVEQKYNEIRKPVYGKRNEIINAIPDFWLTAILSHPVLGELLTEEDQKIFKYLSSLDVEDSKDVKSGYSITFIFRSNPYFEDTKLTKAFTFLDEGTTKVTSTSIKWKEGSEIISNGISDKKGNKRPFHEESFFAWFSNSNGKENVEDMNDDVAEIIKEDLWPNPLSYFNNEADDEEDSEGEGGFEEGQDGECSEEDEEEEDAEDGEK